MTPIGMHPEKFQNTPEICPDPDSKLLRAYFSWDLFAIASVIIDFLLYLSAILADSPSDMKMKGLTSPTRSSGVLARR